MNLIGQATWRRARLPVAREYRAATAAGLGKSVVSSMATVNSVAPVSAPVRHLNCAQRPRGSFNPKEAFMDYPLHWLLILVLSVAGLHG